ncbi:T9SS type A sorting domain-containing protein, partial [Candidatus Eisenbacteria bacterium]
SPNTLSATIDISYGGYGSEDAAHPAGGAYTVYGTASEPFDAGVLVYDEPSGDGQIIFFAFAYSDLSDGMAARDLLENSVAYLYDDAAGITGIAGDDSQVRLDRVRPNPFRAGTMVSFALPEAQEINLAIYDVQGRLVKTLLEGAVESGTHVIPWNGRDEGTSRLAPGIYFLRLSTRSAIRARKMVIQS